jgi:hypothetical protein
MIDVTGYAVKRSAKRKDAGVMKSAVKSRDVEMKTEGICRCWFRPH